MTQIDKDRFFTMAQAYDRMAPYLVPQYEWMQDELIRLLPLCTGRPITIVDLGAGSGRLIEKILRLDLAATCIYVDYSEDFLAVARCRLAGFADRVRFVTRSFDEVWESHLPAAPDAIVSMSAIHHLDTQGKQGLYRRCFEALKPGGWFFNVDEMKTIDEQAYRNSLRFWVRWVEKSQDRVPPELRAECARWTAHFEKWKARNVDGVESPKQKGDDIHEGVLDQVAWLRDAGFADADVFFKYHLWHAIGGRRPDPTAT